MRMNKQRVEELVKAELGDVTVKFVTVQKNNRTLDGVVLIEGAVTDTTVAPTIYYWGDTDEEIARSIVTVFRRSPIPSLDKDKIGNRDFILENVIPQVVRYEGNRFVEGKLAKRFLDLAILYRVRISREMSYVLAEDHVKSVGLTLAEVHEAAMRNAEKDLCVVPMGVELMAMQKGEIVDSDDLDFDLLRNPMLVVTTKTRFYGAAGMLSERTLKRLSEAFHGDFYVIPSSIHDLIVVSVRDASADDLRGMIEAVNLAEVVPEEILSNNLYMYDAELGMLRIA